jgi:hypothetical protein
MVLAEIAELAYPQVSSTIELSGDACSESSPYGRRRGTCARLQSECAADSVGDADETLRLKQVSCWVQLKEHDCKVRASGSWRTSDCEIQ